MLQTMNFFCPFVMPPFCGALFGRTRLCLLSASYYLHSTSTSTSTSTASAARYRRSAQGRRAILKVERTKRDLRASTFLGTCVI